MARLRCRCSYGKEFPKLSKQKGINVMTVGMLGFVATRSHADAPRIFKNVKFYMYKYIVIGGTRFLNS